MILLSLSLLSVFGSNVAKFSGAGALGVLTMSTIAAYGWSPSGKVSVWFFSLMSFNLIIKVGFSFRQSINYNNCFIKFYIFVLGLEVSPNMVDNMLNLTYWLPSWSGLP